MAKLPWIVSGVAVAAYLWSRGKRRIAIDAAAISTVNPVTSSEPQKTSFQGRWIYPLALWNGRKPTISDGFGSPRGAGTHRGVDIMYVRKSGDPFRAGTPNGSAGHVMPDDIAVLAAGDGVVWSAQRTPHGNAVVIDHGPLKIATFYTHMERLLVTPTERAQSQQRVRAGQPIGIVGFSPLDGEKLKHLHFEIWLGGPTAAIDPAPVLKAFEVVADRRHSDVAA